MYEKTNNYFQVLHAKTRRVKRIVYLATRGWLKRLKELANG